MIQRTRSLALVIGLAGFAVACGSSTAATAPTTVSSLTITGSAPSLSGSPTAQFKAVATMSDSTTLDVTSQAAWLSSDSTEATVSATGVVTAVAPGLVNVSATYQNVTGTDPIVIGS